MPTLLSYCKEACLVISVKPSIILSYHIVHTTDRHTASSLVIVIMCMHQYTFKKSSFLFVSWDCEFNPLGNSQVVPLLNSATRASQVLLLTYLHSSFVNFLQPEPYCLSQQVLLPMQSYPRLSNRKCPQTHQHQFLHFMLPNLTAPTLFLCPVASLGLKFP